MTITLDRETEVRVREMADRNGLPMEDYILRALQRQVAQDMRSLELYQTYKGGRRLPLHAGSAGN